MAFGPDRSPQPNRLASEVSIMIEMNEVDHLMLQGVFDIGRKNQVVLLAHFDQPLAGTA